MRTDPILKLKNNEEVRSLFCDPTSGAVLVGTSQGRILLIKKLASNAYLSGNRTIYAATKNCLGEETNIGHINVRYGLIDKIVEIANDLSITRWKTVANPIGVDTNSSMSGIFTTPILYAGEDFGWWGNATWSQTIQEGNKVVLAIRVANSEKTLLSTKWEIHEEITSGSQSWALDYLSTAGAYAQIKVVLESSTNTTPVISSLVLPYYSKHASYFFLTKISMIRGTSIKGGLLTNSVSVPINTAIKWGMSGGQSTNWNDFNPINPDKLFSLPENFGDRFKIGAKMISYDDERYPSIDEFAIGFDSDIDNLINKD